MKRKDIIFLTTATLALVLSWMLFNIYHASVSSTITPVQNIQIKPINPTFDTKIVEKLKKREKVSPIFEVEKGAQEQISTPSVILSSPNISSPSATPTPNTTPIPNELKIATSTGNIIINPNP